MILEGGPLKDYLLTSTVPLADSGMEPFPEGKLWGRIVRMPEESWAINMARAMAVAYHSRIEVREQAGGRLVWAGGGPTVTPIKRDSAAGGE